MFPIATNPRKYRIWRHVGEDLKIVARWWALLYPRGSRYAPPDFNHRCQCLSIGGLDRDTPHGRGTRSSRGAQLLCRA